MKKVKGIEESIWISGVLFLLSWHQGFFLNFCSVRFCRYESARRSVRFLTKSGRFAKPMLLRPASQLFGPALLQNTLKQASKRVF